MRIQWITLTFNTSWLNDQRKFFNSYYTVLFIFTCILMTNFQTFRKLFENFDFNHNKILSFIVKDKIWDRFFWFAKRFLKTKIFLKTISINFKCFSEYFMIIRFNQNWLKICLSLKFFSITKKNSNDVLIILNIR